jgi:hypothetical protein
MALPSVQEMEAFIRAEAIKRGIDPSIAVRVAKGEGLAPDTWQANANLSYGREQSYGPFQLHVAPKGHKPGLGNAFIAKTGLNPADPNTWKQGVQFALDNAATGGWSPWFGAKANGITGMMGIKGGKALGVSNDLQPQNYGFSNEIRPQAGYNFAGSQSPESPGSLAPSPATGGSATVSPVSASPDQFSKLNNYQRTMLTSMGLRDSAKGLDPVQRGILKQLGIDPTATKSMIPQQSGGLLSSLMPSAAPASGGGIMSFLQRLFG